MNGLQKFIFNMIFGKALGKRVLPFQNNMPQFLQENFHDLVEGGYKKNELVYACMNEIARAVPEAPLKVYDSDGDELKDHPMRLLIENPNPFLTEFELWEITLLYMYLTGNGYWEKVRSNGGQVVELYPLRPDRVQIVPDDNDFIKNYIYEIGGRRFPIDKEDIVHFKFPNPNNDFLGMPPLRSALRQVSLDNEATDFAKTLLENSAIPGVVITTQEILDDTITSRLTKKWKQKFGGRNRGEPAFLQEGMDIKTVGMNMKDLSFPELRAISETRICSVFQVPPILVGANTGLQRSTFSNYEEARKSFWQETISPLLMRLSQVINTKLLIDFDDRNRARFDKSNVTALQSIVNENTKLAIEGFNSGLFTRNEGRTKAGLETVENGDVFKQSTSEIFVGEEDEPIVPIEAIEEETVVVEEEEAVVEMRSFKKKDSKQIGIDLLDRAFDKITFAEEGYKDLFSFASKEFRAQGRDFMRSYNRQNKAIDPITLAILLSSLVTLGQVWRNRIQKDVFHSMETLVGNAMREATKDLSIIGIAFDLSNEETVNFIRGYSFTFAEKISSTSVKQIRNILLNGQNEGLTVNEIRNDLMNQFSSWNRIRAENVARSEVIRSSNAGAEATYKAGGIQKVQWLASSDACPFCTSLDGKIIDLDDNSSFLKVGDSLMIEIDDGVKKYTNTYEDVQYPPLHSRCRCTILPVIE